MQTKNGGSWVIKHTGSKEGRNTRGGCVLEGAWKGFDSMTSRGRAKFRGKSEWLRSRSVNGCQLCRLALGRVSYTTLASCHLLTGMVIDFFYMFTLNTYCARLAWCNIYGRIVTTGQMALGDRVFLLPSCLVPIWPLAQEGSWVIFWDQKEACGFNAAWVRVWMNQGDRYCVFHLQVNVFNQTQSRGMYCFGGLGKE